MQTRPEALLTKKAYDDSQSLCNHVAVYRRRDMFGIKPMEILFLAAIVLLIGLVWIFVRMVRDNHQNRH